MKAFAVMKRKLSLKQTKIEFLGFEIGIKGSSLAHISRKINKYIS